MVDNDEYEIDPVFKNSRREARFILVTFACFALFTLSVSWLVDDLTDSMNGEVMTILGLPVWVAVGIVLPWIVANFVTGWFCFSYMCDDDLEPEQDSAVATGLRETVGETPPAENSEMGGKQND